MNDVFNRVEKKYILNKEQYEKLKKTIDKYMDLDPYHNSIYTIASVYLDTDNFELIRKSMDKPIYKEKVRLRSYGTPNLNSTVFLEIKKKYKGHGNKRRIKLSLKDAYDFIYGVYNVDTQKGKELRYIIDLYDLKPKVYIAYDRLAYQNLDIDLRITFDFNIRYKVKDINLENPNDTTSLLEKEMYIMEVKSSNAYPLWLIKILSNLKLYPNSFSKYGNIYKKIKKEGMI